VGHVFCWRVSQSFLIYGPAKEQRFFRVPVHSLSYNVQWKYKSTNLNRILCRRQRKISVDDKETKAKKGGVRNDILIQDLSYDCQYWTITFSESQDDHE
jgi:hypothetical protein